MIFHSLWTLLTKTVRRQLILGVVLVHAVLMSLFIWDLISRQQDYSLNQQVSHATALVQSISISSGGWLLSRDITGLQEIIDAQTRYPELLYAMATDSEGFILAHTDRARRGQFLLDMPIDMPTVMGTIILSKTPDLVDIISPAIIAGQHVGWIRIGVGQDDAKQQLFNMTRDGIIYALAAVLIGLVLANIMGTRLTRRLYSIQSVATEIEKEHQSTLRAPDVGTDEAAQLARQFNKMLDKLVSREKEIVAYNEALHESEARFERSLRGANDGLWEWNIQTNEVYFSPRWLNMLGYDEHELEQDFSTWQKLTYPGDIEKVMTLIQEYIDGKRDNFESEFRMRHKNGHWVNILSRGVLERDKEGKALRLSGTHVDITNRVNAENNLHQLAENINEVFWLGSPSWDEIFYVSPAFEKIWGVSTEELYKNPKIWIDYIYPDDLKQVMNDIPKSTGDIGEYVDFKNYRIQRPDGQVLWVKARAYPIYDLEGNVIRIAGIVEDITDKLNMEETLRRTQKMDAVGKLTGGLAHDYNNMLGVVLGYTELLKMKLEDQPKLLNYVNQIHHAGERGAKLTAKLLSFTRNRSTDANVININQLLDDKRDMLEKTLTARITLMLDLEEELWSVWLDEGELEDAIVNLSINAMHAIDESGQLTIQTRNVYVNDIESRYLSINPGEYVLLSVTDTGKGMDDATKENIFEPFFSTKGEQGTGLGLSQVYGFVEHCHGTIKVHSQLNRGTSMMIYFPRYKEGDKYKSSENQRADVKVSGHGSILIVDDEPALLDLVCEILTPEGYHTFRAESAAQALEILETNKIDLLISDIIMPEMDGYQLAAMVQAKYPGMKIQLVSGFTDNRQNALADDNLHNDLLAKPYNAKTLLTRISELLKQS